MSLRRRHHQAGAVVACVALLLTGCATYRPVVDMRNVSDTQQYELDLSECQQYAQQVDPAANAAVGAVVGALLSAAAGAIFDDPWTGAYAAAGAIGGAAGGGIAGGQNQKDIIRRCMSNRGYEVLN